MRKGILFIWVILFAFNAEAQNRKIKEYRYDNRGDINFVETHESDQPPSIDQLTPTGIRQNQKIKIVADGQGLFKVRVTSDDPNLLVSEVSSEENRVEFFLSADEQVNIGVHTLTFTTVLGFVERSITVQPSLPEITLSPAPAVLAFPGSARAIDIQLSKPDIIDHTLDVNVDDISVAALSSTKVTIPAGSTRPVSGVLINPIALGAATLVITSTDLASVSTRVFVTDAIVLPPGSHRAFAADIGLIKEFPVNPPPLPVRGPFYSQLGVEKLDSENPRTVAVNALLSPMLTIAKGPVILDISHKAIVADGQLVEVIVTGVGLENVDEVEILPGDGVTIGSLTVAPDGTRVSFTVQVDPGVDLGARKIILRYQGRMIYTTHLTVAGIDIVDGLPEIHTVDPIVMTRLSRNTLVVRGENFAGAEALVITPAEGITMSAPINVNAQGTQISATLIVDEFADLGDRLVQVVTGAGASGKTSSPENTISIINGPEDKVSLLMAQNLGVVKDVDPGEPSRNIDVTMVSMGIVYGPYIDRLDPTFRPVGSEFDLTVFGEGLTDVTAVSFVPDDGISVGVVDVAEDGLSLTASVAIDADVDISLRQVLVHRDDEIIPASPVNADRFQVTDLLPIVESLSPNVLVSGDDFVNVRIRGMLFGGLVAVHVEPDTDIVVDTPSVNADGSVVTVPIRAEAGAVNNVRTIIVETAAGESSNTLTSANSIAIVDTPPIEYESLLAPALGVHKDITEAPAVRNLLVTGSLLGVVRESEDTETSLNRIQFGSATGVLVGDGVLSANPSLFPIGTSTTLTVNGVGLGQVAEVIIEPDDGIVLPDSFSVNPEGTQLTTTIDVAIDATITTREIVLNTANGKLPFVNSHDGRLRVTGLQPMIESIEPIQEFPGVSTTLVVRGVNLNDVIDIEAFPAGDEISFGAITVSNGGTVLQAPMVISSAASPGPQVIIVTTLAGATEDQATPANTFTVLPLP